MIDSSPLQFNPHLGGIWLKLIFIGSYGLVGALVLTLSAFNVLSGVAALICYLLILTVVPLLLILPGIHIVNLVSRWFFATRILFDPAKGQVIYRTFHSRLTRPLSDLVAFQLLETVVANEKSSEESANRFYELNLVLDDPSRPRLPFVASSDRSRLRQDAQQLSDFLKVPLVDQTLGEE